MSTAVEFASDSAILGEVFLADDHELSRQHAEWLLSRDFTSKQKLRIIELNEKSEEPGLNVQEQEELDRFLRVGMMLNLLRAKAELTLRKVAAEA